MATTTIEIPEGKSAEWQTIDGKTVLVLVNNKPKDVTERIKTFEDAYNELGKDHPLCRAYYELVKNIAFDDPDLFAFAKLRIIAAALNEGWVPQFTKDEYRYYPYFYLYTQEEINKMSEEDKEELLLVGALADGGALCGIGYSASTDGFSYSHTHIGARLAFRTDELAKYCGKQFISYWVDYVFTQNKM